ncbi:class I SAM-dependent methyltransferase [bacterium]|nr:class I SAM-dependent methyltransferase [bacterium]
MQQLKPLRASDISGGTKTFAANSGFLLESSATIMELCKFSDSTQLLDDVFGWDVKSWSRALPFWSKHLTQGLSGKKVLELGSNLGGLSLLFAKLGANVVCSDIGGVHESAIKLHESYCVDQLVTYRDIDAKAIEFPSELFDVIAFKSILGGIGRNDDLSSIKDVICEMHRVLKPNGIVLFAENLEGNRFHQFFRRRFVKWGREWRYLTLEELSRLFSEFDQYHATSWGQLAALGRSNTQRDLLYFADRLIVPLTTSGSRYIAFGAARKGT